ncbi:putative serine protease K12H4.7 [Nilaparvata lugens]|uniref:putative serine protease K12H4.7 n=1 Tax=Nilaparvata lugens TaxID=108931 RepID=UPI00193D8D40|nr:putative serine protease K12H4.7 [Nilaparvata lugens]
MKAMTIVVALICLEHSLVEGRGLINRIVRRRQKPRLMKWVERYEPLPEIAAHETPPDEYFDQILDHTDESDGTTWKQRFFRRETYYQEAMSRNETNMPVFVMIGGESASSGTGMLHGYWLGPAKKYGALLFKLEHRFYGESHPTKDLSVENLKYLTSEQALGDVANFIRSMKKEYKLTDANKVICFGGSYSGSLSAWMRLKYADMVHGSIASSAPVQAKVDYFEYLDVTMESMRTVGGEECINTVSLAIANLTETVKTEEGCDKLFDLLHLCVEIFPDEKLNIQTMFSSLGQNMAGIVQYNPTTPHKGQTTIADMCKILTDPNESDPLQRFVNCNTKLLGTEFCTGSSYKDSVKDLKTTSYEEADNHKQWRWQTCNEFGYFQSSEKDDSLVGANVPYTLFSQTCRDGFSKGLTDKVINNNIDETNSMYKGKTKISKVCYVQGSYDPWKALGLDASQGAIVIEGSSHCGDMHSPHEDDPQSLVDGRKEIDKCLDDLLTQN